MKPYETLLPHQQRVVQEHTELTVRTEKLDLFTRTDTYHALPDAERKRLDRQLKIMDLYLDVLQERIENF